MSVIIIKLLDHQKFRPMWDAVNDEKRMEPNRIGQRVDKHKNT